MLLCMIVGCVRRKPTGMSTHAVIGGFDELGEVTLTYFMLLI